MKKRPTLFGIPFLWMMAFASVVQEGGGGSPGPDPAKPGGDQAEKPEESQGPKAAEPTMFQSLLGAVQGKGNLVAENQTLKQQLQEAQAKVTTLTADNARLQGEVDGFKADMATLETALKAEEGKTKEVDRAAAEKIVQHGFKGAELPEQKGKGDSKEEQLQELLEREKQCTDPDERMEIGQKIWALETA